MIKISVLTPSYNSEHTLQKAIDSVMQQTYPHWEHIIVDGASKDGTVNILKNNAHLIWKSEPDQGQSDAMNKAFAMSTGDIIVYLNADDFFYPKAFEMIVETFKTHKDIDMVVGNLDCLYEGTLNTNTDATIIWKDLSVLKGRFPLNPISYFYKRIVQERIGNFPMKEHYTMDYWFLLRAFYFFRPIKIDAILGVFVFSETNKSSRIPSEYRVQMPHALGFCIRFTPWRIFYVFYKLFTHPKRSFPFAYRMKKKYHKLLYKLNLKTK